MSTSHRDSCNQFYFQASVDTQLKKNIIAQIQWNITICYHKIIVIIITVIIVIVFLEVGKYLNKIIMYNVLSVANNLNQMLLYNFLAFNLTQRLLHTSTLK